jgi:hypothetical protein
MREIFLDESVSVPELASATDATVTRVIGVAFKNVGLMTTIHERLTFDEASAIAAELGFVARRKEGEAGE